MKRIETLLHYEELNGIDFKLRVTAPVIAQYISKTEKIPYPTARELALTKRNENPSFIEGLLEDERFYKFLKAKYFKDAKKRLYRKETYGVYYKIKGETKLEEFYTRTNASERFSTLKEKGVDEMILVKKIRDNPYRCSPLRKTSKYRHLLRKFMIENGASLDEKASDEARARKKCMNTRYVECADCLRNNVYGNSGCPVFTALVDGKELP